MHGEARIKYNKNKNGTLKLLRNLFTLIHSSRLLISGLRWLMK